MCARLLKAKYYPRGNLLDTVFWCARLLKAKYYPKGNVWTGAAKKGIIQRIGNGHNIQIWRDNWIPREISLKVVTKCRRPRIRWASELFENEHRERIHNLIRSIFLPVDVDVILKIRILTIEVSDQFAWHFEKSGLFSVKSAYKLALQLQCQDQMALSTEPKEREKLWRNIWKADVPPKVCVFAWRLASYARSSNTHKKARHIIEDDTCTICGLEPEDVAHAVAGCPRASALLTKIRHKWVISETSQLQYTVPEWFLTLIIHQRMLGPP
jgi:hypothetical protein